MTAAAPAARPPAAPLAHAHAAPSALAHAHAAPSALAHAHAAPSALAHVAPPAPLVHAQAPGVLPAPPAMPAAALPPTLPAAALPPAPPGPAAHPASRVCGMHNHLAEPHFAEPCAGQVAGADPASDAVDVPPDAAAPLAGAAGADGAEAASAVVSGLAAEITAVEGTAASDIALSGALVASAAAPGAVAPGASIQGAAVAGTVVQSAAAEVVPEADSAPAADVVPVPEVAHDCAHGATLLHAHTHAHTHVGLHAEAGAPDAECGGEHCLVGHVLVHDQSCPHSPHEELEADTEAEHDHSCPHHTRHGAPPPEHGDASVHAHEEPHTCTVHGHAHLHDVDAPHDHDAHTHEELEHHVCEHVHPHDVNHEHSHSHSHSHCHSHDHEHDDLHIHDHHHEHLHDHEHEHHDAHDPAHAYDPSHECSEVHPEAPIARGGPVDELYPVTATPMEDPAQLTEVERAKAEWRQKKLREQIDRKRKKEERERVLSEIALKGGGSHEKRPPKRQRSVLRPETSQDAFLVAQPLQFQPQSTPHAQSESRFAQPSAGLTLASVPQSGKIAAVDSSETAPPVFESQPTAPKVIQEPRHDTESESSTASAMPAAAPVAAPAHSRQPLATIATPSAPPSVSKSPEEIRAAEAQWRERKRKEIAERKHKKTFRRGKRKVIGPQVNVVEPNLSIDVPPCTGTVPLLDFAVGQRPSAPLFPHATTSDIATGHAAAAHRVAPLAHTSAPVLTASNPICEGQPQQTSAGLPLSADGTSRVHLVAAHSQDVSQGTTEVPIANAPAACLAHTAHGALPVQSLPPSAGSIVALANAQRQHEEMACGAGRVAAPVSSNFALEPATSAAVSEAVRSSVCAPTFVPASAAVVSHENEGSSLVAASHLHLANDVSSGAQCFSAPAAAAKLPLARGAVASHGETAARAVEVPPPVDSKRCEQRVPVVPFSPNEGSEASDVKAGCSDLVGSSAVRPCHAQLPASLRVQVSSSVNLQSSLPSGAVDPSPRSTVFPIVPATLFATVPATIVPSCVSPAVPQVVPSPVVPTVSPSVPPTANNNERPGAVDVLKANTNLKQSVTHVEQEPSLLVHATTRGDHAPDWKASPNSTPADGGVSRVQDATKNRLNVDGRADVLHPTQIASAVDDLVAAPNGLDDVGTKAPASSQLALSSPLQLLNSVSAVHNAGFMPHSSTQVVGSTEQVVGSDLQETELMAWQTLEAPIDVLGPTR